MWRPILPTLAAHFRCIALDLKGYGQSDKGRGDYRHEGVATQVIALLDALEIESFSLFSHDRGTVQADHMVARIAPRVRRWVRGSQHLWHYHPDLSPQEHLFTDAETRELLQQPEIFLPRFLGWLCKYPIPRDAVVCAIQEFGRPGVGLAVERYFQSSTFRREWLDRRSRLIDAWRCPTLILQGSDEPPMPREFYTDDVAARLSEARIAFVDGGHFYVEENPAGTLAATLDFLTAPRPPQAGRKRDVRAAPRANAARCAHWRCLATSSTWTAGPGQVCRLSCTSRRSTCSYVIAKRWGAIPERSDAPS